MAEIEVDWINQPPDELDQPAKLLLMQAVCRAA
jgi:hypothetical protein